MKTLVIELRKCKRTGFIPIMIAAGILGAVYACINFIVRKDALLHLPLAPMDMLLTQLYGMIVVFNMFALIVVACIQYNMEWKGNAIKKMYMLPMHVPTMYLCKFLLMTVLLLLAVGVQNLALAKIGLTVLPQGTFDARALLSFTGYSFITSMPVLAFMLLVSSQFENIWIPLGIGVVGFLSSMALASSDCLLVMASPFVVMLKPAVAMSARPDRVIALLSVIETVLFFASGLWTAAHRHYE